MRIDSKPPAPRVSLEPRAASETSTPSVPPSSASVVKLSAAGHAVAGPGPTTSQRLERIRELLDKGEYPVDLDALAEKIVDDDAVRGARKG